MNAHQTFTQYTDHTKATFVECDTCKQGHHFINPYMARTWREQLAQRRHETLVGDICTSVRRKRHPH